MSDATIPPSSGQERLVQAVFTPSAKENQQTSTNFLLSVFIALLGSVGVTQNFSQAQSQLLDKNAQMQDSQNKLISLLQYKTLPDKASTDKINQVNQYNQNIQFSRQDIQSLVTTLRQYSQTGMAEAQTSVSNLQQVASEISSVLQVMLDVMQLINKISQPG